MQVKHHLNTPTIDVPLKITGVFPLPGCEYALRSASGKLVVGKRADSSPILWLFRVPYADFPYSLVEVKGKSVQNMLCRDAVTLQSLTLQALSVNAVRSNLNEVGIRHIGGPKPGKRRLQGPIFWLILIGGILLVNLFVWLCLWPSKSESRSVVSGIGQDSAVVADTITEKPVSQNPNYTYLFIPIEAIREAKRGSYDHLSSQAFPPGTDYYYDDGTSLTIIRIPEVKGQSINPDLGIYLENTYEENCGYLELNYLSIPDFESFKDYLNSKQNRFLVRPADPNKQPKTELVESINTMNLDSLEYKPLDTTPPTGVESTTPTTQQTTPAQQTQPANPKKQTPKKQLQQAKPPKEEKQGSKLQRRNNE